MWTFWRSLWVLLLSVSVQNGLGFECNSALGLEDSQLTAQSYYESLSIGGGISVDTRPRCARLNQNGCAWCAPRGNGQYLQVDLRGDFIITGIATQGFEALSDYYVKRYKVSHRRTGHTWSTFQDVMVGNRDGRSVVKHTFNSPVYARYIRVYPMAYRYRICMRMELYGCSNSSSVLSTTPSPRPTTLSVANNATPENVPPTTRTKAASHTEKPIAFSALSTTSSSTTLSSANIETPKNVPPTPRTTAARRTEKPITSDSSSECNSALGLEDLRIQDSKLTAQSYYESLSIGGGKSVDTEPKCARLNKNNCAWCAPRGNGQYLQVDLGCDFIITGIATQGLEALSDYYVRKYKVSHSRDGHTWSTDVMIGNHDGRSVVRHTFSSPKYARYIRVYPLAYRYRICLRMELYGCSNASSALSTTPSPTTNTTPKNVPPTTRTGAASSKEKPMTIHSTTASSALSTTPSSTTLSAANNIPENVPPTTRTTAASSTEKLMISHSASECTSPLGLEGLTIEDSRLTAQSYFESLSIGGGKSVDTEPKCARLNKNNCAWCAPRGNGQYLQVDLRDDFNITGIATQGFEALSDYYVMRYKVSHSRDGLKWSTSPEVIKGNHDGRSVVRHNFSSPVYARYIRVYPVAYRYRICMRMELYGCSNSASAVSTTPSSTTVSGANNAIPENVPSTTKTKAASSTKKRTGQPVESGEGLMTPPSAEGAQQSGGQALQTGNVAKEMVNDSSRKRASKTVMIALIVVALALMIIICLLVVWLRLRGRKRSYRYSSPKMEVQLL